MSAFKKYIYITYVSLGNKCLKEKKVFFKLTWELETNESGKTKKGKKVLSTDIYITLFI